MQERFQVNSPPVVLETVDEETIIVNLDSGSYYDLNHSGGRVLAALSDGADVEGAIATVAESYGVGRDEIGDSVRELVGRLAEEGIVIERGSSNGASANGSAPAPGPATRPYEDPALGKHTDMQELLLLDPIHEVDGTGWPNRA